MPLISIIMIGKSGVGKTSLLFRYAKGRFKEGHQITFLSDYTKTIDVNGQSIEVKFWDTSGLERYRNLVRGYYRIADFVLLVYNVNCFESCTELQSWLTDFRYSNDSAKILVVGNQSEDPEKRSEEGIEIVRQLTEQENMEHAEASAKTGKNVNEIMQYLIERGLVVKGLSDHYDRPDCITSSSSEETGLLEEERDNLSRNQQKLDDDVIHLCAETPEKSVGKSSLLHRYVKGIFKDHKPTFLESYVKPTMVNGQSIKVKLWDTSGEEKFKSITRSYYRIADGVLLVYSVNNFESCTALQSWLTDFRSVNDSAKIIVVGNKSEVPARSEEGIELVRQLTEKQNLEHAEVSAKTNNNVDETMQHLIERISEAKGILNQHNRPEYITSSSSEETGSHEQGTDILSTIEQSLDDQIIHLDAKTPKKRKRCC